jgi:glycosyltransferase involved in cell wall biosynthesis
MKISIITPSYNQGRFIEEAIKSIAEQGHPDFEHIVIDGGSKDETVEVLKKYPHVKWVSEPDEGQSDAINKGFLKATGDIIGWLNADDAYTPGTFKRVLKEFENKGVDALYSNVTFTNADGSFRSNGKVHKPVKWLALFHCYIPSTTFFFRRSILDAGINIDKDIHISMDKDFFAHIFYKGYKIKYVNEYFARFRWHDSNKSIDTPEIKKLRYKEGFMIFDRYAGKNFLISNEKKYELASKALLVYRKYLKLISL